MAWISLENQLPPLNTCVLMCDCYSDFVTLGRLIQEKGEEIVLATMYVEELEIDSSPTHLMPLPAMPN